LAPSLEGAGLNWSLLTTNEKESFEAGLRTRIFGRLHAAVTAQTAAQYAAAKRNHLRAYLHLTEVFRIEEGFAGEPVTEENVLAVLDDVDRDLGESWRHQLEHAINVSEVARRIVARISDADGDGVDKNRDLALQVQWVSGWVALNWAIDCILVLTDPGVVVQPEVIRAVFDDLREAADGLYVTASQAHDEWLGDPDDALEEP